MTLNEYQQQVMTTSLPKTENFSYMMLNLTAEVGEIAGKVAKMLCKDQVRVSRNGDLEMYFMADTEAQTREAHAREMELRKAAGDVLRQLSGLCFVMGWELEDVARQNLLKLADSQQQHAIDGQGDNR